MSASETPARPASRLGGIIVLGFGGLFVAILLASWASQSLSRRPTIALLLNPYNAAALVNRAEAALDADPPDIDAARRYAAAALRADPLAPRIHRTLARIASEANDVESANAMARLSARFARDGDAQFDAFRRALVANDFPEAAHRLDMIYRGQGSGIWIRIGQAFANIVADPRFATAIASKLGENPPWRMAFLEQIFTRATSVDALIQFYAQIPSPQDAETRLFLDRLVRDQRFDVAHSLFIRTLPAERLEEAGLLYNARFQYGVSNLPFDWVFTRMPNTLTELRRDRNRRLLRVSFFGGRTPFKNVNHLMALAPGAYIFSGAEQAQAFNNARGIRWRIYCTNAPDENIAATGLLVGDIPQRPFNVPFTVGPDCPFQNLQLELAYRVALEQEAAGSVAYSDLDVAAAPQ